MEEYVDFTLASYDGLIECFDEILKYKNTEWLNHFLSLIGDKGTILDLGCGSGRDSKYFIEKGYTVVSIDGSKEWAKKASEYIGKDVICTDFLGFNTNFKFDGIWASGSLHHLKKEDFHEVIEKYTSYLKVGGYFFISVKEGSFEGYTEDYRYYKHYKRDELKFEVLKDERLELVNETTVNDAVESEQQWLAMIFKRVK